MRREPEPAVVRWFDAQPASSLWISSITVLEVEYGILSLPKSRRREALSAAFKQVMEKVIDMRVAPFDREAGVQAAKLMAARKQRGQAGDLRDTMIAGIVIATGATLA